MTGNPTFLITRQRAFIAPEDCRTVAMLVGSGLKPRESDFIHLGAAHDMLKSSLLAPSKEEWSRPLLLDLLKSSSARNALDVFADSPHGAVMDYMTIANLETYVQGEFISYTGVHNPKTAGGLLVCGDENTFVSSDSIGLYDCYTSNPDQEPVTARELLRPLSPALTDYDNLGAIYWNAIFTASNPNITISNSPQNVSEREKPLYPQQAPKMIYPIDHEVWTTPPREFGTDIHFDMLAETIQITSAMIEVRAN